MGAYDNQDFGRFIVFKRKALDMTAKYGNINPSVGVAQRALNRIDELVLTHNFNCGKPDDIFGDLTRTATKNYQSYEKINSDGVIGKDTWPKMAYFLQQLYDHGI